jgi:UDP-glucose 4-epimerase
MRILVTGGVGVNGSWVTRKLLERGHAPVVLENRADYSLLPDLEGKFELVLGDITQLESLTAIFKQRRIERVVHMAAYFTPTMEDEPFVQFSVNGMGTVVVLEAARLAGVERVVYTSSRGYYGETPRGVGEPGYVPIREDLVPRPRTVYDVSKNASEGMGRNFARVYGLQFAALRFSGIYGPGKMARHAHTSLRSRLIEDPFAGKSVHLPDGGDQLDDMIYVDDIAEAIVLATLQPKLAYDAYNIASGEGHTLREFAAAVRAEIPGADIEIGPGTRAYGPHHSYAIFDITRATTDLGWAPRFPIAAGVHDYVETLRRRAPKGAHA